MSGIEYLTVAQARAAFGSDLDGQSDSQVQHQIDDLVAELESHLGHTFGRALLVTCASAGTVTVTATALTLGATSYLFATYPTLGSLVAAANAGSAGYDVELLAEIGAATPSTLLVAQAVTTCGPDYAARAALSVSGLYLRLSAKCESHLFLPLPLQDVAGVVEEGVTLAATSYYAVPGDAWLIRKRCGCAAACCHSYGHWRSSYPGNVLVTYTPEGWGRAPGVLRGLVRGAFASAVGLTPLRSESFGEYSYSRGGADVSAPADILGGAAVRRFAVRFAP